jgi:hypothetical protein
VATVTTEALSFLRIKAVRGLVLGWVSIHFLWVTRKTMTKVYTS